MYTLLELALYLKIWWTSQSGVQLYLVVPLYPASTWADQRLLFATDGPGLVPHRRLKR